MTEEYKFLSRGLLQEANRAAHREKRSRRINPDIVNSLSLNFVCYVERMFYHRKNEVRLEILINENGDTEQLDMSITRYMSLPTMKFLIDGEFKVEFPERPYPNGREWQETEIKRPVRKQDKFRKEVLLKYNSTCSLCSIKEEKILRAAHILGVSQGGPDTINNGICFCVNHEILFDSGMITVLSNYDVITQDVITVEVSKLKLPTNKVDYPSPEYLNEKLNLLKANGVNK